MVEGVGYRNYGGNVTPEPTVEAKANYRAQEPPVGTANFEGRKDYDSFEKEESHTGRNVAIGTGIGLAALYTVAALLGRGKGVKLFGKTFGKFTGENLNGFQKAANTCIDGAYKSAKFVKKYTYDVVANMIKNKKGGTGGTGTTGGADGTAGA